MVGQSDLNSVKNKSAKWNKTFLKNVLIAAIVYLIVKFGIYTIFVLKSIKDFNVNKFCGLAIYDFGEHIDLMGITIGLFIAFLIDNGTKIELGDLRAIEQDVHKSLCQLEETNTNIQKSTENLEDATRKIIETLPGILDESIRIVKQVTKPSDRLLVMNYTSKFGVIHTFNKRFVNQFKDSPNDLAPVADNAKQEYYFKKLTPLKKRIETLEEAIRAVSKITEGFNLVTFDNDEFKEKFIEKYFEEHGDFDQDLLYYPYEKISIIAEDIVLAEPVDVSKISEIVINQHKNEIDELKRCNEKGIFLEKEIPYQMILAEYTDGNNNYEQCFESLMIYAVDESADSTTVGVKKKRNIIGISSKNRHVFRAFETMYNDVKNKS